MENFIVSARKYRPETFESVVGQENITATLKNAIKSNHLGHAYLFCGPRGVGKTTCARILAKTINCNHLTDQFEACNECESCTSFNNSRAFNIHELDAASNNSVDDIRNLIEQVRIPPQVGNYSTYIIDEVHMLSAQAFNSFLKTLEEPPLHAIFILATTEKHKIIPTILSRCQIFDFQRIKVSDIVLHLENISKNEGIEYELDAFNSIANKVDGSMRDALSVFDQLVSFAGSKITYDHVIENLNILDYEYYFRLTQAFLENKLSEVLLIFNEILEKGFDSHHFITGLSNHFRDLLVCRDAATLELLEVGAGIGEKYRKQSQACEEGFLFRALEICSTADIHYKSSRNQRLHVELALISLCNIAEDKKKTITAKEEKPASDAEKPGADKTLDADAEKPGAHKTLDAAAEKPGAHKTLDAAAEKPGAHKTLDAEDQKTELTQTPESDEQKSQSVEPGEETQMAWPDKLEISDPTVETQSHPEPKSQKKFPSTGYSIKEALNGNKNLVKDQAEEVSDEPVLPATESFTIEDVHREWNMFAENLESERPRMHSTLKSHLPTLANDYQISLMLDNTTQKDEFAREVSHDIVRFLQKNLKNNKITIELTVKPDDGKKNKLYTAEEKFEHMNKKNSYLGKLKQHFNLDFE